MTSQFTTNKHWSNEKRKAFCIPGNDPELSSQIGPVSRKYTHTWVGKSMNQIYSADEQVGNAYSKKVAIIQKSTRIPGNDKYAKSYNSWRG